MENIEELILNFNILIDGKKVVLTVLWLKIHSWNYIFLNFKSGVRNRRQSKVENKYKIENRHYLDFKTRYILGQKK